MSLNPNTHEIAIFAERFGVRPDLAHTLPAIFSHIAKIGGMSERQVIADATFTNMRLGEYVVGLAQNVARQVPLEVI